MLKTPVLVVFFNKPVEREDNTCALVNEAFAVCIIYVAVFGAAEPEIAELN